MKPTLASLATSLALALALALAGCGRRTGQGGNTNVTADASWRALVAKAGTAQAALRKAKAAHASKLRLDSEEENGAGKGEGVGDAEEKDAAEESAARTEVDALEKKYADMCVRIVTKTDDDDVITEEIESNSAECVALSARIEEAERALSNAGEDDGEGADDADVKEEALEQAMDELSEEKEEVEKACGADEESSACAKETEELESTLEDMGMDPKED